MKTKQRILNTARRLFNEKGFTQVTIRMIALELGMSSGNLNYHFKKREDIFEQLYFEMVADFDERIARLPETEVSFEQVKQDVEQSMEHMLAYQFFWTDLHHLLTLSVKVSAHFNTVYENRISGCHYLFNTLIKQGLMKPFDQEKEKLLLAERMVSFGNTWLYASRLYASHEAKEGMLAHQVQLYLFMLYPYLSVEGKQAFDKVFLEN